MAELKITPGKWYIQYMNLQEPDESDFWVKSDTNPVVHYGTDIMAEDFGEHNGYPREQRLADANLIAAAPELIKRVIYYAKLYGYDGCDDYRVLAEALGVDEITKEQVEILFSEHC